VGVPVLQDSCEHVLDAIADLADLLSHEWGQRHVLAGSRQARGMDDEQGYQGSSAAARCS